MLDYLRGSLAESHPQYFIIEWMGLGLQVFIPASMYFKAPASGETMTVFTHLQVREDGARIYGFFSRDEREFFRILLGVSGIGPKVALSLMGHLSLAQLSAAISRDEVDILTNVPGIGRKTASRLVYELKDKVKASGAESSLAPDRDESTVWRDVELALVSLGYSPGEISKVKKKLEGSSELQMEELFKKALVLLGNY